MYGLVRSWTIFAAVGISWIVFVPSISFAGKWSHAKGESNSFHASAKSLVPRIQGLDPRGPTLSIAVAFEKDVADLGASIHYDAQVSQIVTGRARVGQSYGALVESVHCNPYLNCDGAVQKEMKRLHDRLSELDEELQECFAKLPECHRQGIILPSPNQPIYQEWNTYPNSNNQVPYQQSPAPWGSPVPRSVPIYQRNVPPSNSNSNARQVLRQELGGLLRSILDD